MSSNTVFWLMTSIVASEVHFSSIFVNHTKSYFGSQGKQFLSKRHWLPIYIYWFINQVLVFKSSMVCKKFYLKIVELENVVSLSSHNKIRILYATG